MNISYDNIVMINLESQGLSDGAVNACMEIKPFIRQFAKAEGDAVRAYWKQAFTYFGSELIKAYVS